MSSLRLCAAVIAAMAGLCLARLCSAQSQLPMEPIHDSGQPVVPAYEGWWVDPQGNFNFMFGYFNRNAKEELDVPIGPNNHIEPAGDYGQPTHFYPRRHWGVFVLTLPKEIALGAKKPAWTLNVNGLSTTIAVNPGPVYNINPMAEIGIGNTPPTLSLDEAGPLVQGPKAVVVERKATVNVPLPLTVWLADDAKALRVPSLPYGVIFQKFRGPGLVMFGNARPAVEKIDGGTIPKPDAFNGKAATTATFNEPGEYVLRIHATDSSGEGGGGFMCCWTNLYARVVVTR